MDPIEPAGARPFEPGSDRVGRKFGRIEIGQGQAMTEPHIDYEAVYRQLPVPVLLLTPEFIIADANQAYLDATGRTRDQLLGRHVFEVFPDNPADPSATGVHDIGASFDRVLATGKTDVLSFQKYDVEVPGSPGLYVPRYWSPMNAPVYGRNGQIVLIANCVEEITERVRKFVTGLSHSEADEAPE